MIDQKTYNRSVFVLVGFVCLYLLNPHARHKEEELAESNLVEEEVARAPQSLTEGIVQANVPVSPATALQIAINDSMSLDPENRPPVMTPPVLRMHVYRSGKQELSWQVALDSATYYVSAQESSRYERIENH